MATNFTTGLAANGPGGSGTYSMKTRVPGLFAPNLENDALLPVNKFAEPGSQTVVAKRMFQEEIQTFLWEKGYYDRLKLLQDALLFIPNANAELSAYLTRYKDAFHFISSATFFNNMTAFTFNGVTNPMSHLKNSLNTFKAVVDSYITALDLEYPFARAIVAQAVEASGEGKAKGTILSGY